MTGCSQDGIVGICSKIKNAILLVENKDSLSLCEVHEELKLLIVLTGNLASSLNGLKDKSQTVDEQVLSEHCSIIKTLHSCFGFCKIRQEKWTDHSPQHTHILSEFFRKCYQILKMFLELFEVSNYQQDPTRYCSIISELVAVSLTLVSIDVMAVVTVWKSIRKWHMKSVSLEPFHSILHVYELTIEVFRNCCTLALKQQQDKESFGKVVKILRFFLGLVLQITKDCKQTMPFNFVRKLLMLLLDIDRYTGKEQQQKFPSPNEELNVIQQTVQCAIDPLVSEFISIPSSVGCFDDLAGKLKEFQENNLEKTNIFSFLCKILDLLSKSKDINTITAWIDICSDVEEEGQNGTMHQNIIEATFQMADSFSKEFFIGKDKVDGITLYEDILTKLCTLSLAIPGSCFQFVESTMLTKLLSTSKFSAMLSIDLWWGSAELCWKHFLFLGKLLRTIQDSYFSDVVVVNNVCRLLKRLFWFLPEETHKQIVAEFPITTNSLLFWGQIQVDAMNVPSKVDLYMQIFHTVLSMMQMKQGSEHSDMHIVWAINTMNNLCQSVTLYNELPPKLKNEMSCHLIEFWNCFTSVTDDIEMSEALLMSMLEATSKFFSSFNENEKRQVLETLKTVTTCTDSVCFLIITANFLADLKDTIFNPSIQESCLSSIGLIYRHLLNSNVWVVEIFAMVSLREFAEVTNYAKAVSSFLPSSKRKDFTQFLKKASLTDCCNIDNLTTYVYDILTRGEERNEGVHTTNQDMEPNDVSSRGVHTTKQDMASNDNVMELLSDLEEKIEKLSLMTGNFSIAHHQRLDNIISSLRQLTT